METSATILRDLAYVFLAAIAGGLVAWRLRLPVIIGYVVAGMLISPLTPGPSVSDVRTLEQFAEIGVVLLMFSIGLQFSVRELLHAKWLSLLGGPLGILLMFGLGTAAGRWLGWSANEQVVLGAIVCICSTTVLTRLLMEHGLLHSEPGRIMVPIALFEDLAAVILIVLIHGLGTVAGGSIFRTVAQELGRASVTLVPALFVAAKVVPPLLRRVARTQSRELFFIVILAACLGTAALTQAIGLSLALGAFLAGMIISGSDYAHEALAQVFPIRDAFLALFFVTMGLLIDPATLFSNVSILGVIVALVLFGRFFVWTSIVRLFGGSIWTALAVGSGVTHIGEFSFILVQGARGGGLVGADFYNATLAASLVTIFISASQAQYVPAWLARRRLAGQLAAHAHAQAGSEHARQHVVLCGFGRVGSFIGAALETFGIPYTVIDIDPDVYSEVRARGIPAVFGDPVHPNILEKAGAATASLLVVTLPDPDRSRLAIQNFHRLNPGAPVVARAHRRSDHELLVRAGATEVIQPELEASATIIRHASSYLHVSDEQVRLYLRGFRKAMYSMEGKPTMSRVAIPEVRELTLANGSLAGRSLREAAVREQFGVTVVSIIRASGETLMNPSADTVLQPGDRLRVLGMAEEIDAFAAQASSAPA
jgi:CPA2 family monovalent cation:H+ antiporter-2